MEFYRQARATGDFDAGIEMALTGVLVSPQFLFRVEHDPAGLPRRTRRIASATSNSRRGCRSSSGAAFRTTSCSTPRCAGKLRAAGGARAAGPPDARRRPFAQPRDQLRGQWLHLRNLESITPDLRLFPDFDDNLRQAFRQETELFVESILREDRSVLDLLRRRLHVPERAAREALRHPERVRQPLPPRRAADDATASAAACFARAAF